MRFVVLVNHLGISRDSLTTSLNSLLELELIQRNPGYGHPLRPEYILTGAGKGVAKACHRYLQAEPRSDTMTRKWTAPILLVCRDGRARFNEIRALLGITPRALTQSFKQLENEKLVNRIVDPGYPPSTSYQLSRRGAKLARMVDEIQQTLQDDVRPK
jgi:DNA-binding HxlR family transcriptional regulator|tara:strand:- start:2050 stop:2523 length:474 start_codon:yes stop_codon:yes gene_type:complete